jgi:group I intron endonuclease
MYGYIYLITNNINGKLYVGKHKYDKPELDKYYIASGILITEAIKKYGLNNFSREIIDLADSDVELNQKEIYWIKKKNSKIPNGYNLTEGGDGITNMSDEIKLKISTTKLNQNIHLTEDHKNKISNALKNTIRTDTWCKNISNSLKQKEGITKHAQEAWLKAHKDKLTYTNGVDVIYLNKDEQPPEGYLHYSKKGYNKLMKLCARISKKEFKTHYNNSSLRDTAKHFNLTKYEVEMLREYYSIELHSKADSIKYSNLKNYGVENVFQLNETKTKIKESKKLK